MEGRTSGEGKGWRGVQLEGKRGGWGMKTEEISDLILTDNPSLVSGCSLRLTLLVQILIGSGIETKLFFC
jgi:hypothetical protein